VARGCPPSRPCLPTSRCPRRGRPSSGSDALRATFGLARGARVAERPKRITGKLSEVVMKAVVPISGAEPRGLVCPQCGYLRFEVVYTRASIDRKIVRRRACRRCGRRITTWERLIGHG